MTSYYFLQTLETMLAAVKKGRPVNDTEIPPPVATGAQSAPPRPTVPSRPPPPVPSPPEGSQQEQSEAALSPAVPTVITPNSEEEQSSSPPTLSSLPSPEGQTEGAADLSQTSQTDGKFTSLLKMCFQYVIYKLYTLF